MNLTIFDVAIIAVYLILILLSGTLVKRYIKDIDNFLIAGRSMGFHLGLLSLMCTEIGMITFVYYAELGYKAGLAALIVASPPVIAYIFLGRTGFIIKPLLEMKIKTIPEFFSIRYNQGVRLYIGIIMAAGGILNFGVFPGVEANFINIITGIPEDYLLITMAALLTLVLVYTAVGGMVSVIVTNYIQYLMLSAGMIFITVFGLFYVGWENIIATVKMNFGETGINPFSPNLFEGEFGLGFLIWQVLFWISLLVGWQAISMRLFSSKNSRVGQKIYTWSALMFLSRGIMPIFWGVMALAVLGNDIEPLNSLPLFLLDIVPSGLLGILLAALLAASMSTYASYLLSWSSIVSQDVLGSIIKFAIRRKISSKTELLVSRITMAFVMIFIIWWSLFHEMEGYLYFYLNMTGMLFIPGVLISVAFGIYWKNANTLGAYFAITLGAILPMLYLIWPSEVQTYASEIGWGGFLIAAFGMVAGSYLQKLLQSANIRGRE